MADKVTKFLVIRATAEGEQSNFEIDIDPDKDFAEQVAKAYKIVDDRQYEMNCRIVASREVQRIMTPETKQAVHTVIQHLQGQVPKATIDQLVEDNTNRRQREYEEAQRHKEEKIAAAKLKREGKQQKVVALRPENQEK